VEENPDILEMPTDFIVGGYSCFRVKKWVKPKQNRPILNTTKITELPVNTGLSDTL